MKIFNSYSRKLLQIFILGYGFFGLHLGAQTILVNPIDVTASPGDTASFQVVCIGASLSYQWQKDGVNLAGASSSKLHFPAIAFSDTGYYRCIVHSSASNDTSDLARLIIPPFHLRSQVNLPAVYSCYGNTALEWGDYDQDGDLDVLIAGYTQVYGHNSGLKITKLFRNDGNDQFVDQNISNLIALGDAAAQWGDYDNDGDIDLLVSGWNNSNANCHKIYRNDGGNVFTELLGLTLQDAYCGSLDWGDYDNDGDLDYALTGDFAWGLRVSRIFQNTGNDQFQNDATINLTGAGGELALGSSAGVWADYDNDGDLDVFIGGVQSQLSGGVCKVYTNDGSGGFQGLSLNGIWVSSAAWGDYDNDGDLDLVLCGKNGPNKETYLYENTGNGNFIQVVGANFPGLTHSSLAWGDYDNDGDLDLLMTGDTGGGFISAIYDNDGFGNFSLNANTGFPGVHKGRGVWVDYDEDGDLDVLLSGYDVSGNTSLFKNNISIPNLPPSPPTVLNSLVLGDTVYLNWNQGMDDHTPANTLSYNIMVGTSPNLQDVKTAMSNPSNGYRTVVDLGNAYLARNAILSSLDTGTYFWRVQSIDQSFKGSAFSILDSFRIGEPIITVHPSDQFFCDTLYPSNLAFRVEAIGSSLKYQWHKDGVPIPGGDSANFYLPSVSLSDTGFYGCYVWNSYGSDTSDLAGLFFGGTIRDTVFVSICNGDSILIGGVYQILSGAYMDTFPTQNACDSIVEINLNVISLSPPALTNLSTCEGEPGVLTAMPSNAGSTIMWFLDPGLTTLFGTGATHPAPQSPAGVQWFYVVEEKSGCFSPVSVYTHTIHSRPNTSTIWHH